MQINSAKTIKKKKGTYLIYAQPGMGKTSAIKYFPGGAVLDIEHPMF